MEYCEPGLTYRPTDTPLVESLTTSLVEKQTATVNLVRARVREIQPLELLLFFEKKQELRFATLAQPGRGATGLSGVRLFLPVELRLECRALRMELVGKSKDEFDNLVLGRSAHRPKPTLWRELLDAILKLCPDHREHLVRLIKIVRSPNMMITDPGAPAFYCQRDQLGVSLDIAGIPRREILPGIPSIITNEERSGSIADGIMQRDMEVPAIFADGSNFPGFKEYFKDTSHARFLHGDCRLDIFVTHNQPFEHQYGSDLVYINHKFGTLVLVQYKMADAEGRFRLDDQATKEMNRMRLLRDSCNLDPSISQPLSDYRLGVDPCFFKLVKRETMDVRSDQLLPGQYFPLWLWEGIWKDSVSAGPKGGRVIERGSSIRHLCKTAFVGLVANGWVGTKLGDTRRILNYIDERQNEGASVMTALSSVPDPNPTDAEVQ